MPRGALSWARLMVSRGTVIWGGGSNPSVVGGHSCIYMHILAIYMHIWHIHAYTCIDLGRVYIHAYMCIYMHICIYAHLHTYKCIYMSIHTYTYIYVHIRSNLYLNMLHQIEVWRCFGAEAADILWLLGVIQSARSPVIGHGTESTSSVMAWGASLRIQEGAAEAQEAC